MKTSMRRFQIHDDLTAPEGSVPVLRGALATGGQLPNFLGVLAGSPAALRAYARFRSELRHGKLTLATLERIALRYMGDANQWLQLALLNKLNYPYLSDDTAYIKNVAATGSVSIYVPGRICPRYLEKA